MRKQGFTLAEVLITLTIIGIVAALTIPSVTRQFQEAQFRNSFKKIYSDIAQATTMVKNEYGLINSIVDSGGLPEMRTVFCQHLKCSQEYGWNMEGTCASSTRYTLYGDAGGWYNDRPCAVLVNGATINFMWDVLPSIVDRYLVVDVNGKKSPNKLGEDVYFIIFAGYDEELKPSGYSGGSFDMDALCDRTSSNVRSGQACAAKVLRNIDY